MGAIIKGPIVKEPQIRHVPKPQFSCQLPLNEPFGALKPFQDRLLVTAAMHGKVDFSDAQIPAQINPANGCLSQSWIANTFLDELGQHPLDLPRHTIRPIK